MVRQEPAVPLLWRLYWRRFEDGHQRRVWSSLYV